MGVAELWSTSILPTLTLPWYSLASSSTMGAIARHGPHQVAQKSISTGLSDFNTSASKFASATSTIESFIVPPGTSFRPRCCNSRSRHRYECYTTYGGHEILTLTLDALQ